MFLLDIFLNIKLYHRLQFIYDEVKAESDHNRNGYAKERQGSRDLLL